MFRGQNYKKFDYERELFNENAVFNPAAKNLMALKFSRALKIVERDGAGTRILDIGCGVGNITTVLASYRPNSTIVGLDISKTALRHAAKKDESVNWLAGEVSNLPFINESFDYIFGFDIVEHVASPKALFNEIFRVLKPGGYVHFHIPCEGERLTIWWFLWKIKILGDLKATHAGHIHRFNYNDVTNLISVSGLKIDKIQHSFHFFGQILDFLEWSAVAVRRGIRGTGSGQQGESSTKDNFLFFLKVWKLVVKWLGIVSFYESCLLANREKSMALDITMIKQATLDG